MKIGEPFNPYRMFTGIFIPNVLVSYKDLSPGAKLCYGRLAQYAGENGEAYPAYKTLSEELGVSKRTVMRYVEELVNKGFLYAVHRIDGDHQTTNIYKFLWHEIFDTSMERKEMTPPSDGSVTPPSVKSVTPPVTDLSPKENQLRESNKKKRSSGDLPLGNDEEDQTKQRLQEADVFLNKLWKLYPRRLGKGKISDSAKLKLLKVGEDTLVKCIKRFKKHMESEERPVDKYPYGSTFFNSGYIDYLDENYEDVCKSIKQTYNSKPQFKEVYR